jgi:UDP-N-acetylglucosamine--N-acetylmuramyl-(pentapeptide) pyrophosphoryl-undecaprenol N-acetylglucosamine transferase
VLTGTPIRSELLTGDRFTGRRLCDFEDSTKPVLLFAGGSLGAAAINGCLREALPVLCEKYRVVHLCGKGNRSGMNVPGYTEFEFAGEELPHLMALADLVVSRAGANTVFELLALRKPNLLIPLTKKASRGDQIKNAASFEAQGFSKVLPEEDMTVGNLINAVNSLYRERNVYKSRMAAHTIPDGTGALLDVIKQAGKKFEKAQ